MVYCAHRRRVYSYALARTHSGQDATDLIQQVFAQAWVALPGHRAELRGMRARIALDGVCRRREEAGLVAAMTKSLGERVFLACHFEPGERVRAPSPSRLRGGSCPAARSTPSGARSSMI